MKRNQLLFLIAVFSALLLCGWLLIKPTEVAFVNYPGHIAARIARSMDSPFIKVKAYTPEEVDDAADADVIFMWGMGISITRENLAVLKASADGGTPVYVQANTNPANNITNIKGDTLELVKTYTANGSDHNYASLLAYARKVLHGKSFMTPEYSEPEETPSDYLFGTDPEAIFETVEEYEAYLESKGLYKPNAPNVAIICVFASPINGSRKHLDALISSIQERGANVYPLSSFRKRMKFLNEINPDLAVILPHGRIARGPAADKAIDWLKKKNIPLLAPLTVMQEEQEWLNDPKGMFGGMLSQSVTMPELDGAIVPYAIAAQKESEEGYLEYAPAGDRIEKFADIVSGYLNLKTKSNQDKKVAVYYFKGPGLNTMVASNLEVISSLYNYLKRLKKEGYKVENLPANADEFEKLILEKGPVLGSYAEGVFAKYLKTGNPELVGQKEYNSWTSKAIEPEKYQEVVQRYGDFPGEYMAVNKGDTAAIAVTRIQFGNVVILPQPLPAVGEDTYKIAHGVDMPPTHPYLASYLWTRYGFEADAIVHFGTHGNLEFIPGKQIALSNKDWTDAIIGILPHFYIYTIGNVGEGMIAKRRSYAVTNTYLTPPFLEGEEYGDLHDLHEKIHKYYDQKDGLYKDATEKIIRQLFYKLGMFKDLSMDSVPNKVLTLEEIIRIGNLVEEIRNEKITGGLYTLGEPYEEKDLITTSVLMTADAITYNLVKLAVLKGKEDKSLFENKVEFNHDYYNPIVKLLKEVAGGKSVSPLQSSVVKKVISDKELHDCEVIATSKADTLPNYNQLRLVYDIKQAFAQVKQYKAALKESPEAEMQSFLNSLNGGYTAPTSGGDPVRNPTTVPTGRNLFSVNAEQTPSPEAWEAGVKLGDAMIESYRAKNNGAYPQKVSFTLWSSSFIETEGATVAEILYLLGVEPIRDKYRRIREVKLIPQAELGRPRIDVVVQTSGQLRDLAASRLFLIQEAIDLVSKAEGEENFIQQGNVDAEKQLVEAGMSPAEARRMSSFRIFGGVNGNYGTGIMGMVESSDRWQDRSEIADQYLKNMGAVYGLPDNWGEYAEGMFKAALQNTKVVIQPRQSNTWGALSLDHVYEFMGGLNATIAEVTGEEPMAMFNDFRNASNARVQDLKEAIYVEARSTLLNPKYIKEYMDGGASSAENFAEIFRNTFGWNVMKPDVIDEQLWDKFYDTYVLDELNLGVREFFERENPYAMEEMTAVMMESIRKGYWSPSEEVAQRIAEMHQELIRDHKAGCSGFVCDNGALKDFIASKLSQQHSQEYQQAIKNVREATAEKDNALVMEKEELQKSAESGEGVNYKVLAMLAGVLIVLVFLMIRRKNKKK